MMFPFMKVCSDMKNLITRFVRDGIEFDMWSNTSDGNVGVSLHNSFGDEVVSITQCLSPIRQMLGGKFEYHPIGLSVWFVIDDDFFEGGLDDELYEKIVNYINGNVEGKTV